MIGAQTKFTNNAKAVVKAKDDAAYRNLTHALASIRKDAQASMKEAKGPSRPGQPPHVHLGRLRRAILFSYDKAAKSGVVGPKYVAGSGKGYPPLVGRIHEFGGTFGGETPTKSRKSKRLRARKARVFPARPFMEPALDRATARMASSWRSSITP